MSGEQLELDTFETAPPADDERLNVDVGSWEGPLDLLLTLARSQKVDLREISILALVDQYLAYINDARALKLEHPVSLPEQAMVLREAAENGVKAALITLEDA